MKKMVLLLLTLATLHASDEYFYLNLGFGRGAINYAPATQNTLDTLFPDAANNAVALDLGLYIALDDLLLGATLNGISHNLRNETSNLSMQLSYSITGLSAIYFLNSGHEGFFVRGDIGQAKYSATSSLSTSTSVADGTGILLGVGYKWWSLFAAVNMTSYTVKDQDSISGTMLNVGFMW